MSLTNEIPYFYDYSRDQFLETVQFQLSQDKLTADIISQARIEAQGEVNFPTVSELRKEFLKLWEAGVRHLDFIDPYFFFHARELIQLFASLKKEGIDFIFSAFCPVKLLVKSQKHLTELRQLGLRRVTLLTMNANQEVLKRYRLPFTPADQSYAIQILQALRFQIHLKYILFEPLTTIEQLGSDLTFLQKHKLVGITPFTDILTSYLSLEPDTAMGQEYRQRGLYQPSADPNLPYHIHDQGVEDIFRNLSFFELEFGTRWTHLEQILLELRRELSMKKPNWVVTNMGQELMYITYDLRKIPYDLFNALLESYQKGQQIKIAEREVRLQTEKRFGEVEQYYWRYRKSYNL